MKAPVLRLAGAPLLAMTLVAKSCSILVVWITFVAPLLCLPGAAHAAEDEPESDEGQILEEYTELEGGGAAASDPTASVNFQDFRYRYFDLEGGNHKNSFEAEGSYAFTPRFKLSHKLVGERPT